MGATVDTLGTGTQFTCFAGTKVQEGKVLSLLALLVQKYKH
jgi:hypothetical protein